MIVTTSSVVRRRPPHREDGPSDWFAATPIRVRHMGQVTSSPCLKNLFGGEIEEYTKMMAESREQALDRMIAEAQQLGADAVLDVRFGTSYVMSSAAEILAYGSAVELAAEDAG